MPTNSSKTRRASSKASKRKQQFFVVQHHYCDHSGDDMTNDAVPMTPSIPQNPVVASFPMKLYHMLDQVEIDGNDHIVSWQPHGRCFVVHKPDLFKELLPKYFNLSKVSSFQRQLNLYDFTRLTRGTDKGGYYNEFFLRGKQLLLNKIQRIKVKGTGVRARSNPEQEPDFWSMPWVGARSNRVSSHSSVISEDEHEIAPQPIQQQPIQTPIDCVTPASSSSLDIQLMGWGKPFFLLESLPNEILEKPAAIKSAPSFGYLDDADVDNLLIEDMDMTVDDLIERLTE